MSAKENKTAAKENKTAAAKTITVNGKKVNLVTNEQIASLDAKTASFNSDTMPLKRGDIVTFTGDAAMFEFVAEKGKPASIYGAYHATVERNGEEMEGFISQSNLQAMMLTANNPLQGSEKYVQVNEQFSGYCFSELLKRITSKTYTIDKVDGLRVSDWVTSTKEKKADGKTFKKVAKTDVDENGKTIILTRAKEFNTFN
jgi:hypothetical protein